MYVERETSSLGFLIAIETHSATRQDVWIGYNQFCLLRDHNGEWKVIQWS